MNYWDNTETSGEHDVWVNWTMDAQRPSDPLVKYLSACVFVMTAGIHLVSIAT